MTNKTHMRIYTALTDARYTANTYLRIDSLQILNYLRAPSAPLTTDYKKFWEKR